MLQSLLRRLRGNDVSSASAGSSGTEDSGSICQRFCQLPQTIAGGQQQGEPSAASQMFVSEPGVGVARLVTGHQQRNHGHHQSESSRRLTSRDSSDIEMASQQEKEVGMLALSPLRRKEEEEENNLSRFLLSEDQLGQDLTQTKKNLDDDDDYNSVCAICTVNIATHYANPCKHDACKICWSRWLSDHKGCVFCTFPVETIQRHPVDLVPMAMYEMNSTERMELVKQSDLNATTITMEQSLERVIRSILIVKDELSSVVQKLQTVEAHLINITRPEPGTRITIDTLTSVLAVEQSSVLEELKAYDDIFTTSWKSMDQEISMLIRSCHEFSELLDKLAEDEEFKQEEELKSALEVFEGIVSATSVTAQWTFVKSLLSKCSSDSHMMNGIIRVFSMLPNLSNEGRRGGNNEDDNDIPLKACQVMGVAETKQKDMETKIVNELIPESGVLLQRLQSLVAST